LATLFASGHIVDFILALIAIEFLALSVYLRRFVWREFAGNLLSGACLLLALRAALSGAGFPLIGLFLFLGFLCHLADLASRIYGKPEKALKRSSP
jgi:hypothetical protein